MKLWVPGGRSPLFREDLLALRKALRGVPHVVLVNVRVPRSWESQVDDALAETREWWPAVRVADWHAASGRSGLLYDGVHPNATGQRIYARLVPARCAAADGPALRAHRRPRSPRRERECARMGYL